MITLYRFGAFLGTPDSSPFVIKVMMLLKLAHLPYTEATGNPLTAPHGLLPYIVDDKVKIADSTTIRRHIERKYDFDFDAGLSAEQRGIAWAVERVCEDHLYFVMLKSRWLDRKNFRAGLGKYMFGVVPAPARPLVKAMLTRANRKRLVGHGLGRLSPAEIDDLGTRDIEALAAILGDKRYLVGDRPCGADATLFGQLTALLTPPLGSPVRDAILRHPNLVRYVERITAEYFAAAPAAATAPRAIGAAGVTVRL